MILNLSTRDGLKGLKAIKITQKKAKNGNPFTIFTVSASKKGEDGKWENQYYSVFSWQKDLILNEGDLVEIKKVNGIDSVLDEYNGVKRIKTTIFAEVNVLNENSEENKNAELSPIKDDDLPF